MKLVPNFILRRIAHRPGLVKIIDNVGWLFLDKILRMIVGLFIGVWVARYLGPEQFGQLNYATTFVALFGSVATLGLGGIVVRDLVKKPECAPATLGTAFVLQFTGSLMAMGLIVGIISFLRPGDDLIKTMVAILGTTLIFKSSSVIQYWFESQVQSRYSVWVDNGMLLIVSGIKVVMILNEAPLIWFVWAILLETVLVAIGLIGIYAGRTHAVLRWKVSAARAKTLLKDSWPLILSGITIMIYMRIDQIMLGEMVGEESVGIYSAALKISEVWYMIPMIIASSVFPAIVESKAKDEARYKEQIQSLLNFMVTVALVIALVVTYAATWLVDVLYDDHYALSAPVLMIHIWAGVFVFIGVAGSKWSLNENLQHLNLYRNAAGAVINVILNFILIHKYKAMGAAVSTVASYAIASYFMDAVSKRTIELFKMKTIALCLGPCRLLLKTMKAF